MRHLWLFFVFVSCGAAPDTTQNGVLLLSPRGFQLIQPCVTAIASQGTLQCPTSGPRILFTLVQTHSFPGGIHLKLPNKSHVQTLYPFEEEPINPQPIFPGFWRYLQPAATDESLTHVFSWDKLALGSRISMETPWLDMRVELQLD